MSNIQPSDYPRSLPKAVPEGKRLVHNSVRPSRRQGWRGARYWLADAGADNLIPCDCGWASELGAHYRVFDVGDADQIKADYPPDVRKALFGEG